MKARSNASPDGTKLKTHFRPSHTGRDQGNGGVEDSICAGSRSCGSCASMVRLSIATATLLLTGGYPGYAASRAYHAMFYMAEAFLEGEELAFSKHSAVIAAFGQRFAQTGKVPV